MKYDLGDLFEIFPDLPWNRTAMTARSAALRHVPMSERVMATRQSAAHAREQFSDAIRRYAIEAARRRESIRRRRRPR
ncbi:MAG TPA: hypothetical protein VFA59_02065 [Vicinamibacterales bacterium]|nr:hypothetical protein [Vicinamibacterales bacterium]